MNLRIPLLLASMLIFTAPARAGEVFGGLYVHDVDTPLTKSGFEGGPHYHPWWGWSDDEGSDHSLDALTQALI